MAGEKGGPPRKRALTMDINRMPGGLAEATRRLRDRNDAVAAAQGEEGEAKGPTNEDFERFAKTLPSDDPVHKMTNPGLRIAYLRPRYLRHLAETKGE